jgi:hypothetical protein
VPTLEQVDRVVNVPVQEGPPAACPCLTPP